MTNLAIVTVVTGDCASEILIVSIIGELYAQVSFFLQQVLRQGVIAIIITTSSQWTI